MSTPNASRRSASISETERAGKGGAPLIELGAVTKTFHGFTALKDVDFDLRRGEVHVLFGENGAGKSTLINIIAGAIAPSAGTFDFAGKRTSGLTPHKARLMGISPVFQEFSLAPNLTVEENLFLGRELKRFGILQRKAMSARVAETIKALGFDLDPKTKVGELSRAHQQMAEIAKALMTDIRVLILDEPTASLTEAETERLFDLIERLKADGVGIIYVSHRMREIKRIADRITILRDGKKIATRNADTIEDGELVELMTGRTIDVLFPAITHRPGAALLEIADLTLADGTVGNASLVARAGEVTGIAGLVGCGKSELVRAVYGLEPIASGTISINGRDIRRPTPASSLKSRVCYFPSDRVAEGLALERPIRENASMAALDLPAFSRLRFLDRRRERETVQAIAERLSLRPANIERLVGRLSGGNRQKVMLARGLTREIDVFLFDEPTVGIDVGAKVEVYELMKALVERGAAIVLVSSELPEVLNLSNRLYVMHRAAMVAELTGADITEQAVLSCFFRSGTEKRAGGVSK